MVRGAYLFAAAATLAACTNTPVDPDRDDTPVSGRAVVLADEELRFLLEDHQLVFNATYPRAEVRIHYLPERELTRAMLADSVRTVFAAFGPGADQFAYYRTRRLTPHVETVAVEAIAVIAGEAAPVQRLSVEQLRSVLDGTSPTWPGTDLPIAPLFDSDGSGVPRTLVDSLFGGDVQRIKRGAALGSASELLARVAADPGALGFISFARLSDLDDERCRALRQGIRLVPIASNDTGRAFVPDQGTLKDRSYPLRRPVVMTVMEGKSGLGTGFASFVAGPKGQRIILKQGLAPMRVPARDVELVQP